MIKLKCLLLMEDLVKHINDNHITIDDVKIRLSKKFLPFDSKCHLETMLDFYESNDEKKHNDMVEYFDVLNKVMDKTLIMVKKLNIPYIDINTLKDYLLSLSEFTFNEEEFFPIPIYISSSPLDEATVGVMMDENGKILELHEGNDESTSETINMVNKLINPKGKMIRIYASHNIKLVQDIEISGYLPKNLYVSPYKQHAESHLDLKGERTMFTGMVNINDFNRESDLDWKTLSKTKIEKFRYL